MILHVFTFYDAKAQAFMTPFFMHYQGQAVRAAIDLASDPNTTPGRYPEDFILYKIGEWSDQTSQFEQHPPQSFGTIASLMPAARPTTPSEGGPF